AAPCGMLAQVSCQPAGGCDRAHCWAIATARPSSGSAPKPGRADTAIGAGGGGGGGGGTGRGAVVHAASATREANSARHNGHCCGRRNRSMWVVYMNIIIAVVIVAA